METLNSMLYLLSYNSEVTTHALGVLSSYNSPFKIKQMKKTMIQIFVVDWGAFFLGKWWGHRQKVRNFTF